MLSHTTMMLISLKVPLSSVAQRNDQCLVKRTFNMETEHFWSVVVRGTKKRRKGELWGGNTLTGGLCALQRLPASHDITVVCPLSAVTQRTTHTQRTQRWCNGWTVQSRLNFRQKENLESAVIAQVLILSFQITMQGLYHCSTNKTARRKARLLLVVQFLTLFCSLKGTVHTICISVACSFTVMQ